MVRIEKRLRTMECVAFFNGFPDFVTFPCHVIAHWRKLYHLGMGKSVTRSNLTKANEQHDYRIFEDFAYHLVAEARSKSTEKIFGFYAFDSTTIDLCLEVFEWEKK